MPLYIVQGLSQDWLIVEWVCNQVVWGFVRKGRRVYHRSRLATGKPFIFFAMCKWKFHTYDRHDGRLQAFGDASRDWSSVHGVSCFYIFSEREGLATMIMRIDAGNYCIWISHLPVSLSLNVMYLGRGEGKSCNNPIHTTSGSLWANLGFEFSVFLFITKWTKWGGHGLSYLYKRRRADSKAAPSLRT